MNTSIILVIKMIFTVDKPVLFPFNTVVDDPNPSIWQKMNPFLFKTDEPPSSILFIDKPTLQIYGR